MIDVTERAVASFCLPVEAVESTFGFPVRSDIFVTVHTEFDLLVTIKCDVTGPALGFNISMPGNKVARHYQRFQLSLCDVKTEHAKHK